MSGPRASRRGTAADIVFALTMLAVSAWTILEASSIPPSPFDPIGSAGVPIWTACLLAGLAVLMLARLALGLTVGAAEDSLFVGIRDGATLAYRLRPDVAIATFLATALYIVALPAAGFRAATVVYLVGLGAYMSDRRPRSLLIVTLIAVVVATAIDLTFRRLLFIDLP